jgi:hypothetical protein
MKELFKSRKFRIFGVAFVLYFGLFEDKSHPDGLGNRLAPQNVKEGWEEISQKSGHIVKNVKKAEEMRQNFGKDADEKAATKESEQENLNKLNKNEQ